MESILKLLNVQERNGYYPARQLTQSETTKIVNEVLIEKDKQEIQRSTMLDINSNKFQFLKPNLKEKIHPSLFPMIDFIDKYSSPANQHCITQNIEAKNTWEKIGKYIEYLEKCDKKFKLLEKIRTSFNQGWNGSTKKEVIPNHKLNEKWMCVLTAEQYDQKIEQQLTPFLKDYQQIEQIIREYSIILRQSSGNNQMTSVERLKKCQQKMKKQIEQMCSTIQDKFGINKNEVQTMVTLKSQICYIISDNEEKSLQLNSKNEKIENLERKYSGKIGEKSESSIQNQNEIKKLTQKLQEQTSARQNLRESLEARRKTFNFTQHEDVNQDGFQILTKSPQDEKIIQFVDSLIQRLNLPLFEDQRLKILPNFNEQNYIIHELEKYTSNKVKECSHLYSHTGRPKEPLAQKPNTIFFLETTKNVKIAGFSSLSYCETRDTVNTKGLLIDIKNKKSYPLKKGKKPVLYDPSHIVFGDDELRIFKPNQKSQIKSDCQSSFDLGKDTWEKIMNSENFEFDIIGLEVYQIHFQKKEVQKRIGSKTNQLMSKNTEGEKKGVTQEIKLAEKKVNTDPEKQELKKKIAEVEKKITEMTKENEILNNKYQTKMTQCSQYKKYVKELEQKKSKQKIKSMIDEEQEKKVESNQNDELKKKYEDQKKKVEKLQKNEEQNQKLIQSKNSLLTQKIKEMEKLKEEKGLFNQQSKKLQTKIKKLEEQLCQQKNKFNGQLVKKEEENRKTMKKMQDNQQEINRINAQFSIQRKNLKKENQNQVNELKQKIEKINEEKQKIEEKNKSLQEQLENQNEQASTLLKDSRTLKGQIEKEKENNDKLTKMFGEKQQIEQSLKRIKQQLSRASEQLNTVQIQKESIKEEKENLQEIIKSLLQSKKQQQQKIKNLTLQLQNIQEKLRKQTQEFDVKKSQKEQIQYKIQQQSLQLEKKKGEANKFENFIKESQIKMAQSNETIRKNRLEKETIEEQISNLNKNLGQVKEKEKENKQKIEEDLKKIKQSEQAILNKKSQLNKIQNQKEKTESQLQKQKKEIVELEKQKVQITNKINKQKTGFENEKKKRITEEREALQEIGKLKNEIKNNEKSLKKLKQEKTQIEKEVEQGRKRIDELKSFEKEINLKAVKLEEEKQVIQMKGKDFEQKYQEVTKKSSSIQNFEIMHLFLGEILPSAQPQKKFLIQEIARMNNRQIATTKFLYRFPTFKKNELHQLIDGKDHFVVLVKLTNNLTIAAYSKQGLVQGVENTQEGFLASLSNKRAFYLRRNNEKARMTSYNEYYLIFGNSELRIKIGEDIISSNLGINGRYFNTGTINGPEVLFGSAERETTGIYEVFQVVFKK